MILSFIFHIVKTALSYIIKIIAWLLVSLSLWVPLIYSLIFVIVCGLSGASLTALQSWYFGGLAVSFLGSFAVSTYLYERGLKSKRKQRDSANIGKVSEKQEDLGITKKETLAPVESQPVPVSAPINTGLPQADTQNDGQPYASEKGEMSEKHGFFTYPATSSASAGYGGGQKGFDGYSGNSSPSEYYKEGQSAGGGDYNNRYGYGGYNSSGYGAQGGAGYGSDASINKYGTNQSRSEYGAQSGAGYGSDASINKYGTNQSRSEYGAQSGAGYGEGESKASGFSAQDFTPASSRPMSEADYGGYGAFDSVPVSESRGFDEKPKIFATRNDPTIFIYEYSDRLEYYKRTRSGMVLMNTKHKATG